MGFASFVSVSVTQYSCFLLADPICGPQLCCVRISKGLVG